VLVLTAFAARGFWTGFVGEVAGLLSIVGGFWVSHHFHTVLAPHLTFITEPAWRNIASYVLLFLGVLIAVGLLARLLQKLLAFSFVGWIDKLTGGLLGLAKGVLLCAVVLLLLQKLFGDAEFLRHSRALPYFNSLISQVRGWLPPDLISRFGL